MPATTAQLRNAAYDVAHRGHLLAAARLYDLAAARYPRPKYGPLVGLALRDADGLRERAASCRRSQARLEQAERDEGPRMARLIAQLKEGR